MPSRPLRRRGSSAPDALSILLEEYRQVYGLALFRLGALDQRVPVIGATLTAVLGSVAVVPQLTQTLLLIGLPLSLVWFVRTTVSHARSFEDALRRIEAIEQEVNKRAGQELMLFQRSHPSRGVRVGGRTGSETIEAVLAASALLLGGCLYLSWTLIPARGEYLFAYATYVGLISAGLIMIRHRLELYRYEPATADRSSIE